MRLVRWHLSYFSLSAYGPIDIVCESCNRPPTYIWWERYIYFTLEFGKSILFQIAYRLECRYTPKEDIFLDLVYRRAFRKCKDMQNDLNDFALLEDFQKDSKPSKNNLDTAWAWTVSYVRPNLLPPYIWIWSVLVNTICYNDFQNDLNHFAFQSTIL